MQTQTYPSSLASMFKPKKENKKHGNQIHPLGRFFILRI